MCVSTHALAGVTLEVASSDVRAGGSVGAPRVGVEHHASAEADEADGSDVRPSSREVLAGAVT